MASFTIGLVIADMWFWRSNRVITHVFLGGIATALFYILCQKGFEIINLAFILLFALSIIVIPLFKLLFTVNEKSNTNYNNSYNEVPSGGCTKCGVPASSCSCVPPPPPIPESDSHVSICRNIEGSCGDSSRLRRDM